MLRDERVVVVAEQKPNCTDEEAHTWMNSVVPAVESIHGVNLYGLVLVASGRLPRGANGLVQVYETRQNFIKGLCGRHGTGKMATVYATVPCHLLATLDLLASLRHLLCTTDKLELLYAASLSDCS